jgi:hypothetical protein
MICWTPIAVNERPLLRGRKLLPEYSAAVIGASVVLRYYGGGMTSLSIALTTIAFASAAEAEAWVAAHRMEFAYCAEHVPGSEPLISAATDHSPAGSAAPARS